MPDQHKFTPGFSEQLMACLIMYPEKFAARGDIIKPEHFDTAIGNLTIQALQDYREQWGRIPSFETLSQIVHDTCADAGVDAADAATYLDKIAGKQVDDVDFVVQRVVDWCRERALINAVKHSVECIKAGTAPKLGYVNLFESALQIGANLDDLGYVLNDADSIDRIVDSTLSESGGVKTGIPLYDQIWRFGWGPGWLIALIAPPKRYKTITSINLATSIAGPSVGADVIYYACEISQELAALRACYNITGLTEEDLLGNPDNFKTVVKRTLAEKLNGRLIIKGFPLGAATVPMLESHTNVLVKQFGIKPKAIVVDYADTVATTEPNAAPHIQQANIYKQVIAMGKRHGSCIIMPDRCTAEASEMLVPNMRSFQGAFAKGGITDIAIGLCATAEEHSANRMRHFVFVNRHGPAEQHFEVSVDPARARISVDREIDYDPAAMAEEQGRGGRGGRGGGGRGRQSGNPGGVIPSDLVG